MSFARLFNPNHILFGSYLHVSYNFHFLKYSFLAKLSINEIFFFHELGLKDLVLHHRTGQTSISGNQFSCEFVKLITKLLVSKRVTELTCV